MSALADRHHLFWELHQSGCFVIPNPWDAGSARLMAAGGAKALATTSAGFAFTLGRPDMGRVTRDEALEHCASIVASTSLPVSGDLENGFADGPDEVAETVRMAREAGLSGCSIEDTRMVDGNPAYDFDVAVARIEAAVDAARSLEGPFVLCARADGVMNGTYGIEEAIARVTAFETAGADLLYVPAVPAVADLERLLSSVDKPVNALAAGPIAACTVDELAEMGVRRISVGSMLARMTHQAIIDGTRGILADREFGAFAAAASGAEVDSLLEKGSGT